MMTVIKFSTSSCVPCTLLKPLFDSLKEEYSEVDFVEVEIDTTEFDGDLDLVKKHNIRSVPVMLFLDTDGSVVGRESGVDLSGKKYRRVLDSHTSNAQKE